MKILYLTSNLKSGGGISKYNLGFLDALSKNGARVEVVELKKSALFFKLWFAASAFLKFVLFNPRLVISAHVNFLPLASLFKIFLKKDYLVETYGIDVWDIKSNPTKEALRNAKLIITVANYTKQKILEQIPEIDKKVVVLPNFVDGEKFKIAEKPASLMRKHNLSDSSKIILTLCRLSASEKYKGYDKVIEAMPLILSEVPEAKYFIVGSGDDALRVRELIERMHLGQCVVMTGQVSNEERLEYYNLCDVFAMPSKGEGFASVFLEALACGKSVVGGNKDGSIDPLLNGEVGILVDPDSVEETAKAIITLLKKEASPRLTDRNFLRQRTLEAYGLDKFQAKVGKIFNFLRER